MFMYMNNSQYNQLTHACFKIDHVWSSGKFSFMFIVCMVITDEDKKIIWKVQFLRY